MALTAEQIVAFADLGAAAALRHSELIGLSSEGLAVVLARLHRVPLVNLDESDRAQALAEMVEGCQRRWRATKQVTQALRKLK